jgi:hypothetical protein
MKKLWVGVFIFIGLATATIARAATDIGPYYWVFKQIDRRQTSTAAPVVAGAPYHFFSLVEIAPGGQLMQLSNFVPPGGSVLGQQNYSLASDGSLQYDTFFSSQQSLDNAFHSGKYQLDLRGRTVNYLPKLNLGVNVFYSTLAPKLSNTNFRNGQLAVDAAAQLTLSWNSFSDHDANGMDIIVLIITNTNGNVTVFRDVLPATATSKTFAANFFKKNENYIVDLSFVKVSNKDTASISGSTGLTGYARTTHIFVSTSTRTPLSGLANISTRGLVGTGDNVLISGFIITSASNSTVPMTVVVRALGPSLVAAGITNVLMDPTLDLFDGSGNLLGSSDDWESTPGASSVRTAGLGPRFTHESALYRTLPPGGYTVVVRGKNNTTGTGLVEVYNLGSDGDAKLANISTRGQVLTNNDVLIGGLIIQGPLSHSVLLRALGPSIAGVAGVLQNPTLQVVNAQGGTLSFNNDWRDSQEAQIQATGLAPGNDKDSAVLQSLSPGGYTAIIRSKNTNTGVALVEAYALD